MTDLCGLVINRDNVDELLNVAERRRYDAFVADAPVRALVIEQYASGRHSFASLAEELNRDGYRCRSGLFTKGVVAKIIGDPIVIGGASPQQPGA